MSELHVVATIPARPESVADIRTVLQTLAAPPDGTMAASANLYECAAAPAPVAKGWTRDPVAGEARDTASLSAEPGETSRSD